MFSNIRHLTTKLRGQGMISMLVKGSGTAFFISSSGLAINYLANVYLARIMGTDEYGIYAYVLSWAMLLAVPAGLGLNTAVLKLINQYSASSNWSFMKGVVRQSWVLTCVVSTLVALVGSLITRQLPSSSTTSALFIGMWMIPLFSLLNLQASVLRAQKKIFSALAPINLLRYIVLVVGVFLLVKSGLPVSGVNVVLVTTGTLLVLLIIQLWPLLRSLPKQLLQYQASYKTREWLVLSLPLLFTTGALVVIKRTDVLMIGAFGNPEDVGVYYAAARVAALASFTLSAINAIAAPLVASAYARNDQRNLQRLAVSISHLSFWPSLAIAIGLVLFSDPILGLFGSEFQTAKWELAVLVLGYLVNAATGAVGVLLNMTGYQNQSAVAFGVSAVVNVALNFFLIPLYGILGAAIATALTMLLWNVWLYVLVVKNLGIHASIFKFTLK